MARRSRESLNTSFFHVIVQGINKEYIFEQNRYKEKYLKILNKTKEKYNIEIIAYCIMSNHAHILIYTENIIELSNFMKDIDEDYARYYNYVEERVGYVFKGRFLSEAINDEKYLLNCIVYIHNNPVKAKMVEKCELYKYSSYEKYLKKDDFLNRKLIENMLGKDMFNIEKLKKIHMNKKYYFMENGDNIEENMKEIIIEFENRYKMQWEEIIKMKDNIKDIIMEIKERMKISNNRLAKYLDISRSTIDRIIKTQ